MKHITRTGLLRTIPLVVVDVFATFAAYAVASWATMVAPIVFWDPNSFGYFAFYALVAVGVYAACRMYSCLWEYASMDEAMRLVLASLLAVAAGGALGYLLLGARLPLRVYAAAWILFFAITAAGRFAIRVYSGRKSWSLFGASQSGLPRSLIVGAGETLARGKAHARQHA